MTIRNDIETELKAVFAERFVHLWWGLNLPALEGLTPEQVFARDPQLLLDYVKLYR